MPVLRILLGTVLTIALVVVVGIIGLNERQRMAAVSAAFTGEKIERGGELYADNCAACHGENAEGIIGPCLNCPQFFAGTGANENEVRRTIAAGRPPAMPTWEEEFGGPLTRFQVDELVAFIMNFANDPRLATQAAEMARATPWPKPAPGEPGTVPAEYEGLANPFAPDDARVLAAGQVIFVANCAPCHGEDGTGVVPGALDFGGEYAAGLSDAYYFFRVSEGVPFTAMPPWKDRLSEEERWQVITYERSFHRR